VLTEGDVGLCVPEVMGNFYNTVKCHLRKRT